MSSCSTCETRKNNMNLCMLVSVAAPNFSSAGGGHKYQQYNVNDSRCKVYLLYSLHHSLTQKCEDDKTKKNQT